MKSKTLIPFLAALILSPVLAYPQHKGGMWVPSNLEQTIFYRMQEMGLSLTAEDIYSVHRPSLTDVVVQFSGGCSGVLVSESGLFLTNHHCALGQIQRLSTSDRDILADGFWARSKEEELPNVQTNVIFLQRMEDVTDEVLRNVTPQMSERERADSISAAIARVREANLPEGSYRVDIRPLFNGNQYFMYVYEVFTDIRLVAAPPSSIGRFGGIVENWTWPRHGGDFTFFRIYADSNNRPADYSPYNVPFRPKLHARTTICGINEGDFTMVIGYPGSTQQYITSYQLNQIVFDDFPLRVGLRTKRLEIFDYHMNNDRHIAIQYAAKHAGVSNPWKRWQAITRGIKRINGLAMKQEFERNFNQALQLNPQWMRDYGQLLSQIRQNTEEFTPINRVFRFYNESVATIELVDLARQFDAAGGTEMSEERLENFFHTMERFYRDYSPLIDREMFVAMMRAYYENIPVTYHFDELIAGLNRNDGCFERWADEVYSQSAFRSEETLRETLKNQIQTLENDPFLAIHRSGQKMLNEKINPTRRRLMQQADSLERIYMAAQMKVDSDRVFFPDANGTMRVSFGRKAGYSPADGVWFGAYTTLTGVMEKDNPEIFSFNIPEVLRETYRNRNFGRYAIRNGTNVPVNFIASNHTPYICKLKKMFNFVINY
ncbi:MAG: S46 family peptidase [Bacteroidales bacterium]|nr:S46 family peptidase [Bacteroidales bacterium]